MWQLLTDSFEKLAMWTSGTTTIQASIQGWNYARKAIAYLVCCTPRN